MRIEEQAQGGRFLIQGYGDGGFRVAGKRYQESILVLPSGIVSWQATCASDITYESFRPAIEAAGEIDVLLLGTGKSMAPVDRALIRRIREEHGIAIDLMDTGAACRTFNVLLLDGRLIAAALLPVA
ncbi:Mth938-like domain-containing protein [Emcibacter sp. SYSU 3D8]|uniref:Mth938-like domain-containing protein n=1 Tax=Emcibacter sp. SYSU 3D8 TaxID=3133969 RepID=UPI0031FF0E1B